MNNLKNSVRLIGFLGNDPEVKLLENNKKLARISIAINESYQNDKGQKVESTQWHNIVLWNKQAELAEKYMQKGSEVAIEGKLSNRNYVDKDGTKKYVTEVIANEVLLIGSKK